jgi:hypothetical protein
MRTQILILLASLVALISAIPITPSAPRLQKRAEQFRLQGLREVSLPPTYPPSFPPLHLTSPLHILTPTKFEIAQRLSASPAETATFRSRLNSQFLALFHSLEDYDLAGDIAPGSLDAPSMLPRISEESSSKGFSSLRKLLGKEEEGLGYEGKEGEMRRPTGSRHWAKTFGGFRRFQGGRT